MASFKDSTVIEKLNSSNYSTWSFKMEMLLTKEELFEAISDAPPNPVTQDWNKKDKKAKAFINLFIDNDQIVYVKTKNTARETWDTLKTLHERSNLSSKLYLLRSLYSCKLSEGGNMIKHITKILEITDKLTAIGERVNDSHLSALLLCSLPPSYDTLITALEARPEEELTPSFIQSKLTDEYNRRAGGNSNYNTQADNSAKAYKLNKNFSYNNQFQKQNKFCTYCKLKNHNNSECRYLKYKNTNRYNNHHQNGIKYKNQNKSLCCETNREKCENDNYIDREQSSNTNKLKELAFIVDKTEKSTWIIDSGCSAHISNNRELFDNLKNTDESNVMIANGNILTARGYGDIIITTETNEGNNYNIRLKDVLYVPDLESNLLSVKKATENGCTLFFSRNKCYLKQNGITYLEGKIKNSLYEVMQAESAINDHANLTYTCNNNNCITLWHKRLGHRNYADIKEMVRNNLITGLNINFCKHDITCETCIKSKITNMPYPKKAKNRANRALQLIHSDLCGPFQTPTIGGKLYIMTLIDDYSRYTVIYLLKHKNEVTSKLNEYILMVENKFGRKPERLRSDNGGEYISHETENLLKANGIQHELAIPHCAPQNGVAERKNRSLVEMTRSMLSEANLNNRFWGEAANTANYLLNRLPTKANDKTPYELWHKRKPDLSHLKVFGCKAFAFIDETNRKKLDDKAVQGTFVGYDNQSKGYRIYVGDRKIKIARTVKFIENSNENTTDINKEKNEPSQTQENLIEVELSENSHIESDTLVNQPRRSLRSNRGVPPERLIYLAKHQPIIEPQSWSELQELNNPIEKENWLKATEEELKSLKEHNTWTLVEPPQGKKIIGSRWLFKAKYDDTGKITKYKSRLVARGYNQKFGENYDETFAPVVSHATIRSFLNAAAYNNLEINHIDIKTAFLHGDLNEEIYMKQPEGFIIPGKENMVCKLNKAIYGLKQAARA